MSDKGDKGVRKSISETKGDKLKAEAEKKLKSFSWFSSGKYDDAIELYTKAAAQYKIDKEWEKAGDAYVEAAAICEKHTKSVTDATSNYTEAAKCYKNDSGTIDKALKMYNIAVTLHQENNRFSTAAKLWKEIAQLEEKAGNIKKAIQAYSECANCFEADDAAASANQALLKVADLSAGEEDYKRSIQIYEKVATSSMESSLGRWSVKDYLFKALVCHFVIAAKAGDLKSVETALSKYRDSFPAFEGSREEKLIENTVAAFKEEDEVKFTKFLREYDRISKLDPWFSRLFLEIKNVLTEGVDAEKPSGGEGSAEDEFLSGQT